MSKGRSIGKRSGTEGQNKIITWLSKFLMTIKRSHKNSRRAKGWDSLTAYYLWCASSHLNYLDLWRLESILGGAAEWKGAEICTITRKTKRRGGSQLLLLMQRWRGEERGFALGNQERAPSITQSSYTTACHRALSKNVTSQKYEANP